MLHKLTVSKNLMPYSSASAWPRAVGTAYKTSQTLVKQYMILIIGKWWSYGSKKKFVLYPFALVHVCFVAHQYFVNIIRRMLLNVPDPVPYVYIDIEPTSYVRKGLLFIELILTNWKMKKEYKKRTYC